MPTAPQIEIEIVSGTIDVGDFQDGLNAGLASVWNDVQAIQPAKGINNLLIYYGYPIAFRSLWDVQDVVQAIAADYDIYVVGMGYEDPAHAQYATTMQIIAGLRTAGVRIYGYVPMGVTTANLTTAQIRTRIDQWKVLNVDGIFLDEFGFDYGVSRQRQIDAVTYCHDNSLNYCANAWIWWDVAADNVNQLPESWAPDDWRRTQFTTGNPTNLVLPRTPNDSYLFENLGFSNTGPANFFDVHHRVMDALAYNPGNLQLWGVGVLAESTPGVPNFTIMPQLPSIPEAARYCYAIANLYGFEACGIGGFSFGSGGIPIESRKYVVPPYFGAAVTGPMVDNVGRKATRAYRGGALTVITNHEESEYAVVVESDSLSDGGETDWQTIIDTKLNASATSTFGRSLIDDADAAAARTTLGLGNLATLSAVGLSQIANDSVNNTKLANMATGTIKGRVTAATGDPEDLTAAQVKTMLSYTIADVAGLQTALDSKAPTASVLTTEQLQDLIAAMFQGGTHTNASVTYDDAAGTISVSASGGGTPMTQEQVEDFVGALVQVSGTGLTVTYDDAGNALRIGLAGESYTTAEKNKLAAIAAGATANATDAQLRDRATHTGTQAITTIAGLQAALDTKAPALIPFDFGTITARVLTLADAGKILFRNNAAANTVTIPANADAAFPVGTSLVVLQQGTGTTTVVGAAGVTVNGTVAGSVAVVGRNQQLTLYKVDTNAWIVSGGAV